MNRAKLSMAYVVVVLALSVWMGLSGIAAGDELNPIDTLKKIPAVNNAVIFNLSDNEWEYAASVTVASITAGKVKVNADIGWTPRQELLALVSMPLLKVSDYLSFPILNWIEIEPGVYAGWDRLSGINMNQKGNAEFSWGAVCKLIKVKF